MKKIFAIAAALAVLTGCQGEQQAGGVTADEAEQLNEAAKMLDESPGNLATDETGLENGAANSQ